MNVRKTLGAVLGAGALVVALAGTAFAETGNQTDVAWNAGASDCTGGPNGDIVVPDGQVAWVFVHTQQQNSSGTLTANFENAGQLTADSYIQGGLKYLIITDIPDTLNSFSDDLTGGQLTLSHTCYGAETSSTSSTTSFTSSEESSSTSETSSSSSSTSFSESVSDTTSVVPSQPNTATIGSTGSSTMSNGIWMLIAALGVVGGSVLVLMPSRAKGKR
ncbi:MAG TPA: hypothetical protein VGI98_06325 [Candidatus Limnocylindrales bacterium]